MEKAKVQLKETEPMIESSRRSNRRASSKKRQTTVITTIVKPTTYESSRSRSAHTPRTHIHQHQHHHPTSTPRWDVTTFYPYDYYHSGNKKPTKYITEIYDKATKRFIPTNC